MQLTGDIDVKTIEGEERWIGKESTRTLFAGATDDGRAGVKDRERKISDDTKRRGGHSDECHWME